MEMKSILDTNSFSLNLFHSAIHSSSPVGMYKYSLKTCEIISRKTLLNVAAANPIDATKQITNNPKKTFVSLSVQRHC